MFKLENTVSVVKKRKRVGRGGGRGGTSGKGHKGQKARSGGSVRVGFEGGQMPLYRRLPKRGFTNARFKTVVEIINVEQLNAFDDDAYITKAVLIERGLIKPSRHRPYVLKILGDGALKKKVSIVADLFSAQAKKVIEETGGKALTQEV